MTVSLLSENKLLLTPPLTFLIFALSPPCPIDNNFSSGPSSMAESTVLSSSSIVMPPPNQSPISSDKLGPIFKAHFVYLAAFNVPIWSRQVNGLLLRVRWIPLELMYVVNRKQEFKIVIPSLSWPPLTIISFLVAHLWWFRGCCFRLCGGGNGLE